MDKDRDVSGIADATLAQGPFVSDQAEYPQHKSGGLSTAEPPLVRLTRIKPVPLTGVWSTEPHHFTPWLLENAELLSEVLGIDVELEAREYPVGKFWLDIIGREVASGTP